MVDFNKNFEFTVKYVVNEDKSWNVSYHSEEDSNLTENDIDNFLMNILLLKQKREISKRTQEEIDRYNKMSLKEKIKYNLKFALDRKSI